MARFEFSCQHLREEPAVYGHLPRELVAGSVEEVAHRWTRRRDRRNRRAGVGHSSTSVIPTATPGRRSSSRTVRVYADGASAMGDLRGHRWILARALVAPSVPLEARSVAPGAPNYQVRRKLAQNRPKGDRLVHRVHTNGRTGPQLRRWVHRVHTNGRMIRQLRRCVRSMQAVRNADGGACS